MRCFEPTIDRPADHQPRRHPLGPRLRPCTSPRTIRARKGSRRRRSKTPSVTFPAGMAVNPSQAAGLAPAREAQIGFTRRRRRESLRFSKTPAACPDAAKLGTVEATSPLLAQKTQRRTKSQHDPEGNAIPRALHGSVYLAKPFAQPLRLAARRLPGDRRPEDGIVAKLAGKGERRPATGQLTTRSKKTPSCRSKTSRCTSSAAPRAPAHPAGLRHLHHHPALTPWSAPEGKDAHPDDSFAITAGARRRALPRHGRPRCPTPRASKPARSPLRPAPTARCLQAQPRRRHPAPGAASKPPCRRG